MGDWRNKAIAVLGIGFIAFQLYILYGFVGTISTRIFHVCFAFAITFLMKPLSSKRLIAKIVDFVLLFTPVVTAIYIIFSHDRIESRLQFVDPMTAIDVILGTFMVIAAVEATRRALGVTLTILVLIFIGHFFLGPYLPGLLAHSSISFSNFVENNFIASTGMFGTPVGVSVQYVFYFIMFGCFVEMSGGAKLFTDLAMRVTGRSLGGPAKVSVVSSALFGMISGSAVANVAVDGVITIPLMQRAGFPGKCAAAIEAIASTGGQLMPPVMGAAAFVLAEWIRIPYIMVCKAAILPALLYYAGLYVYVHLEAASLGLPRFTKDRMTEFSAPIFPRLHLVVIPVGILIYSIATWVSIMTAALRAAIAAFVVGFFRADTRPNFSQVINTISDIGKISATIAVPCAAAGIIIGSVTLTGTGLKFTDMLLYITGGLVIPTLLLTMIACIILGMGMPTTAAYIMAAVLMSPALTKLGFPPLQTHFFIFYFAILSMVTPPVAVAAYTAAGIAKADMFDTGWEAFRMAIPSFLIPFVFISSPVLLLEHPSLWLTIWSFGKTLIGVISITASIIGWLKMRNTLVERVLLFAAGLLMLFPEFVTDIIGLILFGVIFFRQRMITRKATQSSP